MCATTVCNPATRIAATGRFYRPELDVLRFFAFLAVFLHHGPSVRGMIETLHTAAGFGLSMFFLLSAFLITELLVRERDHTRTVSWRLFFIRRALRIWPLYFTVLGSAFLIGHLLPGNFHISRKAVVLMVLFLANWTTIAPSLGLLIGHLWSISVEEQFYLIWPPILKIGGRKAAFLACCLLLVLGCVWILVFADKGWLLWYDTPVEFLFFAAGALLSLVLRGGALSGAVPVIRWGMIIAGSAVLWIAAVQGRVEMFPAPGLVKLTFRYGGALIGCVLIFLAVLGMPSASRVLVYLGKISYGLYVFHLAAFQLTNNLAAPLHLNKGSILNLALIDCVALLLTVGVAALSYKYLENPFMHMKERFAIIPSRPA